MTQENQPRKFLEVLRLNENSPVSFYLIKDKEGFDEIMKDKWVTGDKPVEYPCIIQTSYKCIDSKVKYIGVDVKIIDAPDFVSTYMGNPQLFEAGRKLTIGEVFNYLDVLYDRIKTEMTSSDSLEWPPRNLIVASQKDDGDNKQYGTVWEAIEDNAEDVKKMTALSEAMMKVTDLNSETALRDTSDGTMKKVLTGKISQLCMNDLYRVMWLNKLHTRELNEICTRYDQPIPTKEHYQ